MSKVRCQFCNFEKDGKCAVKKMATVKLSKKRACSKYVGNKDKIEKFLDSKDGYPQAIMRPDWWWDKEARRVERDRIARQKMEQNQPQPVPDKTHPLTGDLSKFMESTAQDAE